MTIKSVILAAGKGTRMKSETPKVLHKIFDKALLDYVIESVKQAGKVDESFVIVGHKAELVEAHINKVHTDAHAVLQTPQLGTGHAVSMVCPQLENFDGEVIILCGDTPLITSESLNKFINSHYEADSDISVMSAYFDNPKGYGRIIRNSDEKLSAIVEEKDADVAQKAVKEVNAGIYCLNWQKIKLAFSELKSNNAQGEYYLTDIISWGRDNSLNVNAFPIEDNDEIFGINSKLDLAVAAKIMNKRNLKKLMESGVTVIDPETTWISSDTEIEPDTIIYPSVYITGKNTIGTNCSVGPFAHIRGGVTVGNNVKIGNFVEVKNSTIADDTNVCHLSYIGDSDLGSHVNIGAGTITANYNPLTKVKSRTVMRDNVKIGSNSVLVAPVELEEGVNVGAGSVITKDIPAKSLALTRGSLRIIDNWVK